MTSLPTARPRSRTASTVIDATRRTPLASSSTLAQLLELYADLSLGKLQIGDALGELLELVRPNRLRLPGNLVLFFKALAMCEGLLQAIDPQASFSDYLRPMIEKMILQEAKQEFSRVGDCALDAIELGLELPGRLDRVLARLARMDRSGVLDRRRPRSCRRRESALAPTQIGRFVESGGTPLLRDQCKHRVVIPS